MMLPSYKLTNVFFFKFYNSKCIFLVIFNAFPLLQFFTKIPESSRSDCGSELPYIFHL